MISPPSPESRARTGLRVLGLFTLAASIVTCFLPSDEGADQGVQVYEVLTIQRLEPLEGYAARGADGVRQPARCDSTASVPSADPVITCTWQIVREDLAAPFDVSPPMSFRLGDRIVVRARVGRDGAGGTEVHLHPLGEGQRGPSALRVVVDTLDLLSVGDIRLAVFATGFPGAAADTLTLFTHPARLPPKCGTQQTSACVVDSLAVGAIVEIPGGPFAVVRDPVTGAVVSVLPEPEVTIGGLPAPVIERTDTLLRVAVPAGAGSASSGGSFIRVAILGLPAVCTPSILDDCYKPKDFAFLDWDVLEPGLGGVDSLPTELTLSAADSVLATYPALALEGTNTAWAVDAAGLAQDWYAFALSSPIVVDIEVSSALPLDVRLADTLAWDPVRARPRIAAGAWAVGSRPACQGIDLNIDFPERGQGGTKVLTVALPAGRYHLVVSGVGATTVPVGYGLEIRQATTVPDDDGRCDSALPLTTAATGTLDGSFDLDWYSTTSATTVYADLTAAGPGAAPGIAVLRDGLPDSLPIVAQGSGRALPLLTPGRHLIAVAAAGGRSSYDLAVQAASFGPPVSLDLTGLPPAMAVCETRDVTVTVRDALGNRVLAYAGTVVFSSSDPAGTLPAAYPFTVADSGRHRFASGVTLWTEGARTVSVTGSGAPGLVGAATISVTPPTLRVSATPAVATVAAGEQVAFATSVVTTCGEPAVAPVTWTSLNPARATMTGNTATGVASGQVTLRADAGAAPTYVHLTVTAPRPSSPITWDSVVGTTPGENLRAVWAAGPDAVWAVGTPGLIMAFDGSAWTTVRRTGVAADTLFGVWGTGPSDVWAVGTGGTVLHFDGSTWTSRAEAARTLRSVWAASPEDVWIAGDASTLLRFDGAEFTSVPVAEFPNVNHLTVWGRTPTDVWIAGTDNILRRYDGVTLATLAHRAPFVAFFGDTSVFWTQGIGGVSGGDLRYWTLCRKFPQPGQRCSAVLGSEVYRWTGGGLVPAETPPVPEGTVGAWSGQSVIGTDDSEFWHLTTQGLVVGTGTTWTTLLSSATTPVWDCNTLDVRTQGGDPVSDLLTTVAAGFVSLPGDVWVVGTCARGSTEPLFQSLILRGRY